MCTSIFWNTSTRPIFANNEDIFLETGYLFSNQRGIAKEALIFPPEQPLKWVSKYGSLVFSQCGKEFPSGGMNEAGLVVEQMTLPETRYPDPQGYPSVKELQLIQYLLDSCSTTSEAIDCITRVQIAQASGVIHYFMADKSGECAIVEYLDGSRVIYHGDSLPVQVLANSAYAPSLASLTDTNLDERTQNEYQLDSLRRFQMAAHWAGTSLESAPIEGAFQALAEVAGPNTIWRIVYDMKTLTIHIQTSWNQETREISLSAFDFSSSKPGQVYDLHTPGSGNIQGHFLPYTTSRNQQLVFSFFRNETIISLFGGALPDEVLEGFAAYPMQQRPLVEMD